MTKIVELIFNSDTLTLPMKYIHLSLINICLLFSIAHASTSGRIENESYISSLSKNGDIMLYTSNIKGVDDYGVYMIKNNSTSIIVDWVGSSEKNAAISNDGNIILFDSDIDGIPSIWITNLKGNSPKKVINYGEKPIFSPSSDKFLYLASGSLYSYDIKTKNKYMIQSSSAFSSVTSASWYDEKSIIYTKCLNDKNSYKNKCDLYEFAENKHTRLTFDESINIRTIQSEKNIVYLKNGNLINLDDEKILAKIYSIKPPVLNKEKFIFVGMTDNDSISIKKISMEGKEEETIINKKPVKLSSSGGGSLNVYLLAFLSLFLSFFFKNRKSN